MAFKLSRLAHNNHVPNARVGELFSLKRIDKRVERLMLKSKLFAKAALLSCTLPLWVLSPCAMAAAATTQPSAITRAPVALTQTALLQSTVQALPMQRTPLPDEQPRSSQQGAPAYDVERQDPYALEPDTQTIPKSWGGDIELGFVFNRGNTDATAIRTNLDLTHEYNDYRNKYLVQSLYQRSGTIDDETGEKNPKTSAQKIYVVGQTNYKFYRSEHMMFGRASYLNDRFGAFREQASFATGYANRLYNNGDSYWDFETGPGVAYQETAAGENSSGIIWFAATTFNVAFNERNSFKQAFEWGASLDGKNSTWQSRSNLTSHLNGQWSMRLSLIVKFDSDPGPFRVKKDTETAATIVYSF
jgi:putative salt-induced outer membrane protein YdiY